MNRKTFGISIPAFLIFLFLTTIVVTSFHYETDLIAKADCATCKVASDLASNDTPQVFDLKLSQPVDDLVYSEVVNGCQTCFLIPHHSRAPPAFVLL